ncbi:MAG: hydrogenase nickel incorporation protein HypB [Magnetococcus sp. WYHC-3]
MWREPKVAPALPETAGGVMCTDCGCSGTEASAALPHHHHPHAEAPLHGVEETARRITVEEDLLSHNQRHAAANRRWLAQRGVLALNLLSGPGAGKTTLLEATLTHLDRSIPRAVIEGDPQTSLDAQRIRRAGAAAVQLNTGKGCHLDAHGVGHALEQLDPPSGALLFIENLGNLVCPAAFDLGEARRVVLLSVAEGDDKPLKYPDMFLSADLVLITKVDLLPHVDFDVEACRAALLRLNPKGAILPLSARSGTGMAEWLRWLRACRILTLTGHPDVDLSGG